MSKHTIGAGDASRHAQNIGTSPPQVQSTVCPRCRAPAILMRAGRCLTVARVVRASKAEPQVSPSPCIWCCKQRVEHFAVLIYLPSMRLTAILKGWRRSSLTIHWQDRSPCHHHRIVDCSTCLRPQFRDGVFEYACDVTRGGVSSAPYVAPRAPLVFAKRIRPAWSCVVVVCSMSLFLGGLQTCQTRRPRRLLEFRLIRPLSFQARANYLQAA